MAPSSTSSSLDGITIRRATAGDLPALGALGASLLRTHYAFDSMRFMAPPADPESGYAWFLGTQLKEKTVGVFVAERSGSVIGYVYAGLEPQSWKELRDAAGFIHDVVVAPEAQRHGVASALIDTACEWFRSVGAPRVVLWTAEKNEPAQQLFTRLGFRKTMIEMTREL
jgi:ribosomal protein S18 acetylase RimI-like enzyme